MPETIDALTEEIATLVHALVDRWDDYLNARVRELDVGLTGRQAVALWMAQERLPMGVLAERLGCDPSSATGIVSRMEAKGLLRRVGDPDDGRAKRVELTAEGRRLRRRIERRILAARPSLVGLTRAERRTLRDLLRKAMAGL